MAFHILTDRLEVKLFQNMEGLMIKDVRDQYREILHEIGVRTGNLYSATLMKDKLYKLFDERISFLQQTCGSGFICASTINIGDAVRKLQLLAKMVDHNYDYIMHKAAQILRADALNCKKDMKKIENIEVSTQNASHIVPDSFFNFCTKLIVEKASKPENGKTCISVDTQTEEKVLSYLNSFCIIYMWTHNSSGCRHWLLFVQFEKK